MVQYREISDVFGTHQPECSSEVLERLTDAVSFVPSELREIS